MLAVSIILRLQTSCSCNLSVGQARLRLRHIDAMIEQHDRASQEEKAFLELLSRI